MVQEVGQGQQNNRFQNTIDAVIQGAVAMHRETEFHPIQIGGQQQFNLGNVLIKNAAASRVGVIVKQGNGEDRDVCVVYPNGNLRSTPLEARINGAAERVFDVYNFDYP